MDKDDYIIGGCIMVLCAIVLVGIYVHEANTIDVNDVDGCIRKVDKAIKKGDHTEAYLIVDQMIAFEGDVFTREKKRKNIHDTGYRLNEKILTDEIAANVEEGNTTRIILCIKERAKYNSGYGRYSKEIEMFKHALQLATFVENDDMVQELQNALDTWE